MGFIKHGCVILVVLMSIVISSSVQAGDSDREAFYRKCIDQKISQCELKARFVNSRGEHIRDCGEKAMNQASFYQSHEQELIQEMIDNEVGTNVHQVDYFLINAYHNDAGHWEVADR